MSILDKIKEFTYRPREQDITVSAEALATAIAQAEDSSVQKALVSTNVPYNITTTGSPWSINSGSSTSYNYADLITKNSEVSTLKVGKIDSDKTKLNSEITIFGKITIIAEDKTPNKFIQWIHKKFFGIQWKDISCAKCTSKLSCLVNKTFESNCKIK